MNLYRKYRPQSFSEIVGQEQVVGPLLKQLETGKISHAYLFSGPRGTGKTSTARLLAKAINCEKNAGKNLPDGRQAFGEPCNECLTCKAITEGAYLDVLEIDAASNRGIDEIRDLREKIGLAPTSGRFKVYIIDEVHMLTNEAFNALLKTLEEPPPHAIFILATTELRKVPATIQSRSQKFEFHQPGVAHINEKLAKINSAEKVAIEEGALIEIAKSAGGAFRDAEVLLEKVIAVNPNANLAEVQKILGRGSGLEIDLLDHLLMKKTKEGVLWLENYVQNGGNPKVLAESLVEILREILLLKVGVKTEKDLILPPEISKRLITLTSQLPKEKLTNWISLFSTSLAEIKDSPIPQLPLELAIIEACEFNENSELRVQNEELKEEKVQEIKPKEETKTEVKAAEEPKTEPVKEEAKVSSDNLTPIGVSAGNVKELQEKWNEILQKVKPHNNSVEIFLRSATPLSIEDDTVVLGVGYGFHKDRLEEPKNIAILDKVFSEILDRAVRIKVVVGEKKSRPKAVEAESKPLDEADPVEVFGKLV